MKIVFLLLVIAVWTTVVSCNNKSQTETTGQLNKNDTEDNQQPKSSSANIPSDLKNILGEWTMVRRLRDDNGNGIIDGEEEKTAIPGARNYMKLNGDGTCKYQTLMDGKYEIVTAEDGRKKIVIHDLYGNEYPFDLYIVSVTENELVINSVYGGSGLEVFKRP